MSVSAIFGTSLAAVTAPPLAGGGSRVKLPAMTTGGGGVGLMIECSSRPQKKATAHHRKTRPRKTQQWDIKRRPTVYAPLPPLPPDWTLVSSPAADEIVEVTPVSVTGDESQSQ